MKILIAEDEKEIAGGIKSLLSKNGHEVVLAQDGIQAFEYLNTNTVDLIITDIIMPEMDGVELILKIRKKHPKIRIIAISGGGRISADEHLESAFLLGAEKVLKKPFGLHELLNAIDP
jgi:DNA-binding response OmpR family regulator